MVERVRNVARGTERRRKKRLLRFARCSLGRERRVRSFVPRSLTNERKEHRVKRADTHEIVFNKIATADEPRCFRYDRQRSARRRNAEWRAKDEWRRNRKSKRCTLLFPTLAGSRPSGVCALGAKQCQAAFYKDVLDRLLRRIRRAKRESYGAGDWLTFCTTTRPPVPRSHDFWPRSRSPRYTVFFLLPAVKMNGWREMPRRFIGNATRALEKPSRKRRDQRLYERGKIKKKKRRGDHVEKTE